MQRLSRFAAVFVWAVVVCPGAALAAPPVPTATAAPLPATTPAPLPATTPALRPATTPASTAPMTMYRPWDLVCNGVDLARFSNAGGLGMPAVTIRPGTPNGTPAMTAGLTKPVIITLTVGQQIGDELRTWSTADRGPDPRDKRNCLLTAVTAQGVVTAKWSLTAAWPSRLDAPNAMRSRFAISELQLTVQSATHQ